MNTVSEGCWQEPASFLWLLAGNTTTPPGLRTRRAGFRTSRPENSPPPRCRSMFTFRERAETLETRFRQCFERERFSECIKPLLSGFLKAGQQHYSKIEIYTSLFSALVSGGFILPKTYWIWKFLIRPDHHRGSGGYFLHIPDLIPPTLRNISSRSGSSKQQPLIQNKQPRIQNMGLSPSTIRPVPFVL